MKVWIDYDLPPKGFGRALPFLGDAYAFWCVDQMAQDARRAFGGPVPQPADVGFRAERPAA